MRSEAQQVAGLVKVGARLEQRGRATRIVRQHGDVVVLRAGAYEIVYAVDDYDVWLNDWPVAMNLSADDVIEVVSR